MEIIKKEIINPNKFPKILKKLMPENNFVLFDIETTGLNPSYSKVVLIGLLYLKNNKIIIEQLFCHNSKNEIKLLKTFKDKIKNFEYYITYNGGNFDIPFLNKRLLKNNIDFSIDPFYNFDLYKIVKKNKNNLGLKNCKLKTVEKFLGINRKDTISGADSVNLYKEYEKTLKKKLKEKILLHNYEDILYLLPVLNILNFIDENDILSCVPFQVNYKNKFKLQIHKCNIKKDFLIISGKINKTIKQDYIFYEYTFHFEISSKDNNFFFKIPLLNINLPNKNSISLINIDEINIIDNFFSEINNDEINKYIVKVENKYIYSNLYDFIKNCTYSILDKLNI
ncbi:hypothetical protein SAMN02745883_02275 [Caminicella sporogenes DSM 14501]|uniref:YprB ribonuclease H-like domain-containing protein n=1 Tax=Caminicella sporogenes DSM 14501 TaxID=1121266 RepID=A0A1M6T907_9FIRM|nr:ribonuclease H-like domain-containing protein [Caminicella sporogenes]RKD26069.1 hypothetical protein BET04_10985 [Caminicella sporogenes]SHK53329.1 hypothetical protein SAMN02745883_02275 [Caminicella sporogenes DSM 14501]